MPFDVRPQLGVPGVGIENQPRERAFLDGR